MLRRLWNKLTGKKPAAVVRTLPEAVALTDALRLMEAEQHRRALIRAGFVTSTRNLDKPWPESKVQLQGAVLYRAGPKKPERIATVQFEPPISSSFPAADTSEIIQPLLDVVVEAARIQAVFKSGGGGDFGGGGATGDWGSDSSSSSDSSSDSGSSSSSDSSSDSGSSSND